MSIKLAETSFRATVIREYSTTPHVDNLGTHENKATLYHHGGNTYTVEWTVEAIDSTVSIGIWTEDKSNRKVFDYDGVFSLPVEIARFLQAQGFDLSNLYDSQPELIPVEVKA